MPGGDRAGKFVMSHRSQTHRGNTTALRAVGVAAKLTGCYPRLEIRRDCLRCLGEDAVIGKTREETGIV